MEENDPYRRMDSGEEEIQPDFLKKKDDKSAAKGLLSAAEQVASAAIAAKTGKAPSGGEKAGGGKTGGGLYTGSKGLKNELSKNLAAESAGEKSEAKLDGAGFAKKALPFFVIIAAVFGLIFLVIGMPVLMIGAIDYNLQKVLGFTNTIGILEKVGEYVTAELAMNGEFPSEYASELAKAGVEIGQVTANGDFYRTDTYIANIEEKEGLVAAAGGFSYVSDTEGQLSMLYDGKVIQADDFVAAVESDPKLYAAYSGAADISTKFYYGSDVEGVYKDLGLSRGNFNNWDYSGDYDKDEEAYQEILTKVLDNSSKELGIGGRKLDLPEPSISGVVPSGIPINNDSKDDGGTWSKDVISLGNADEIVAAATEKTKEYIVRWEICKKKDENGKEYTTLCEIYSNNDDAIKNGEADSATQRAAELLNTAVSSNEPYLATNAFIAIEEAIQRARVDGDGPVNHVMNSLTQGVNVSYQDAKTGDTKTSNLSILETANFRAAVSDSGYSLEEANNFGRDRVLQITNQTNKNAIRRTVTGSAGKKDSGAVVRNGIWLNSADKNVVGKATESVKEALETKNSELFQSTVGGNRIIEGGSYLSNTINMRTLGAMPSGSQAISEYHKEVEEVMARKAEAERASLSPFDISSSNTFLGSIVNNIATAMVNNYSKNGTAFSAMSGVGDMVGKAANGLMGTAIADGSEKEYTTLSGTNCATVNAIEVEGDIYCNSHNTLSTKYIDYNFDKWKAVLGEAIDDNGNAVEGKGLNNFMNYGMMRYPSVGVKSAEVCEEWKKNNVNAIVRGVTELLGDMFGLYDACSDVPDNIATGAAYSFGPEADASVNAELYSGYVTYNEVRSLLTGAKSAVADFREKYDALHPQDDSHAGMIARRSGMTKAEAEIALAYADYLDMVASYDASSRYAFGEPLIKLDQPILETHTSETQGNLYAWYQKETEYRDERNRQEMTA